MASNALDSDADRTRLVAIACIALAALYYDCSMDEMCLMAPKLLIGCPLIN